MDKSKFLNYTLELARKLSSDDGRSSVNANYYMIALLKLRSDLAAKRLPKECIYPEFTSELYDSTRFLNNLGVDCSLAYAELREAVKEESYSSTIDDFIFNKFAYNAEAKAKELDREVIDAKIYTELILCEPTQLIRQLLFKEFSSVGSAAKSSENSSHKKAESTSADAKKTSGKSGTGKKSGSKTKAPKKPEPTIATETESDSADAPKSDEDIAKLFSDIFGKSASESEEKAGEPVKPANPTGSERLGEIVGKTAEIQKFLLDCVFGQDLAVNSFVSGYFQSELVALSRKEGGKPKATFLFAGPPGTGKTFLAEKAAEALALPYMRFDMSEYADKEANIEFCGSDKVYKNGKPGNVTGFVEENPKCVLLFDEIEKAHISVIYLFLQILDAGRIRDNYTDNEVSFSEATVIFTTNVGKNLYDDSTITNLSALPRKKIIKALSKDMNPQTNAPLFPAAICSRFAAGNVVMFNHLGAGNLYNITERELSKNLKGFEKTTKIKIELDPKVSTAIMLSEGGKADARTVKGRANAFFHDELYELFRLLSTDKYKDSLKELSSIKISVDLKGASESVASLFVNATVPSVLLFAEGEIAASAANKLKRCRLFTTSDIDEAKDILFNNDISLVLCDVRCGAEETEDEILNVDDILSTGTDFLHYLLKSYSIPTYLIEAKEGDISGEELLSFVKNGVIDALSLSGKKKTGFEDTVFEKCELAYQQSNMLKLARENKLITYKTRQTISKSKKTAVISLFDIKLSLATDVDDSGNILDGISRPNVKFGQVIGAEDAKRELSYFVEYLKNPVKYLRQGLRAPKGILLYGPPGTGKTLLAKAMAGESDVTFITAEGNQFLKRYVGEGANAVHSLFNSARKYAPSILFIDEIDAIGKNRNLSGAADSTGDVLTAFLTEMDGFNTDTTKPVFVLAATNYGIEQSESRSLDSALLRRFDRKIYVDLPNKEQRLRFLKMKLEKTPAMKISQEQIENIAVRSAGMSLAELDSVLEFALRNAICCEDCQVGDEGLEEAFETYNGGEKKTWSHESLLRTARHEAGHALVCWLSGDKPSYVTVVSRGNHGGYMQNSENEGKSTYTRAELLSKIRTALAGRAAEIVYYGDEDGISTGASSDIYQATKLAKSLICTYGMDAEMGLAYVDSEAMGSEYFTRVQARVKEVLDEQLKLAVRLVTENKFAVNEMVDELMVRNHLKGNEIDSILKAYTV